MHEPFSGLCGEILNDSAAGDLDQLLFSPRKGEKLFFIAVREPGRRENVLACQLYYLFHLAHIPQVAIDVDHLASPHALNQYLVLPTGGRLYLMRDGRLSPLKQNALRCIWAALNGFMDRHYRLLRNRYTSYMQPLAEVHENRKIVEMLQFKLFKRVSAYTYELAARVLVSAAIAKLHPKFDSKFPLVFERKGTAAKRRREAHAASRANARESAYANSLFVRH